MRVLRLSLVFGGLVACGPATAVPGVDGGRDVPPATPRDASVDADAGVDAGGVDAEADADTPPTDAGRDVSPVDGGEPCATNDDCDPRTIPGDAPAPFYCALANCAPPGVCRRRPMYCPGVSAPLCDCAGQTHSSPCQLAGAGASIRSYGPCPDAGP